MDAIQFNLSVQLVSPPNRNVSAKQTKLFIDVRFVPVLSIAICFPHVRFLQDNSKLDKCHHHFPRMLVVLSLITAISIYPRCKTVALKICFQIVKYMVRRPLKRLFIDISFYFSKSSPPRLTCE
ncbi:hypothetical protein PRUPE_5G089400 [Prunus persica]|uniref:Uncharacterized protein n=1 Tax=Prunus persica TaxID=3760 RepID=A0A251P5R0_PRUPE|nr:hypothetical protein PRUPE_5G089400 [Prunus persica]